MNINQMVFDLYVSHEIEARNYVDGTMSSIAKFFDAHQRRLKRAISSYWEKEVSKGNKSVSGLSRYLSPISDLFATELRNVTLGNTRDLMENEYRFSREVIKRSTHGFYNPMFSKYSDVADRFLSVPIYEGLPLDKNVEKIGRAELVRVEGIVKRGIIYGNSLDDIAKRVEKTINVTRSQSQAIVRTAMTAAKTHATTEATLPNGGVVRAYEYTAILDSRTTDICRSRDGMILSLGQKGMFPPSHINCRSFIVPVFRSRKELEQQARNFVVRTEPVKADDLGFVPDVIYYDEKYGDRVSQYYKGMKSILKPVSSDFDLGSALMDADRSRKTLVIAGKEGREHYWIFRRFPNHNATPRIFDGIPSKRETAEDWLRRQPHEVKLDVLGSEERVRLFEEGNLDLVDFFRSKSGKKASIAKLRNKDNSFINFSGLFTRGRADVLEDAPLVRVTSPGRLTVSKRAQKELQELIIKDAQNPSQTLSLTDYRGIALQSKRAARQRVSLGLDDEVYFDPVFNTERSTSFYAPDFSLLRERLDAIAADKALTQKQRDFIIRFVNGLEDKISTNQQTVVAENLRMNFSRYNRTGEQWDDFSSVFRKTNQFAVQNVSKLLETRSRSRSSMYGKMRGDERFRVFLVDGEYTFDDIIKRFRDDTLYIRNWGDTYGYKKTLPMAGFDPVSALGSGRKAWISIKQEIIDFLRSVKKYSPGSIGKRIVKSIKSGKLYDYTVGAYINKNRETLLEAVRAELKGMAYSLFEYHINLYGWLYKSVASLLGNKERLRFYNKLLQEVAMSGGGDYDAVAIRLGNAILRRYRGGVVYRAKDPFDVEVLGVKVSSVSIQDKHRVGSAFLKKLQEMGYIRSLNRGVTRRAVTDIETGRAGGAWKDTVSREIVILDDDLKKLAAAMARTKFARRIGIVTRDQELEAVPGWKVMRGPDSRFTNESIYTRRISSILDEKQDDDITRPLTDMVNKAMSVKYTVDKEYVEFMSRLYRFRDPRGNTKYYDELNTFRQEIKKRGVMGEAMIRTAEYHSLRERPFKLMAKIDGRGRLYFSGYLTPTGGEIARPFLASPKKYAMTPEALNEIKYHLAVLVGSGDDVLSIQGRLRAFAEVEKDILKIGELISSQTQRDRRIREFLTNPVIQEADPEEVATIARLAQEYYRAYKATDGFRKPLSAYKTNLLTEIDASASAVQIISIATGRKDLAKLSNVLEGLRKNRIYDIVAMDVKADPRFREIEKRLGVEVTWKELSKGAKAAVMLAGYGAGRPGIAVAVASKLEPILQEKGLITLTRADFLKMKKIIRKAREGAERGGSHAAASELKQLEKEMELAFKGDREAFKSALDLARKWSPDVSEFMERYESSYAGMVTPDDFKVLSNLMVDNLEERVPGMRDYINFWKKVAVTYIEDTGKVAIPIRTFDGTRMVIRFRPTVEEEIRFYDPVTGRMVRNIYRDKVRDDKFRGKMSIAEARTGLGVHFTHANDASVLRMIYKNIDKAYPDAVVATVHDALYGPVALLPEYRHVARSAYAKSRAGGSPIMKTLQEMRASGLSEEKYRELVQLSHEHGLVRDEFGPEDIMRSSGKGGWYYGWDY